MSELKSKQNYNNKKKEIKHRINKMIRVPEVRLVGDNIHESGEIFYIEYALKLAEELNLDLVEINNSTSIPVCKIIDYKKFLYETKKKNKEIKNNSHKTELKDIRFTPNTDDHDFDFKLKHAIKFLKEGNKVKATVQFKGRAIQFKERGELILLRLAAQLTEIGTLENMPIMEGKKMIARFSPKSNKK